MGEAKKRKAIDPYYGIRPKRGRGIFLSAPIVFDGKTIVAESSSIDPAELRRAALFWDRLVWPDSQIISFGSNCDEKFLEDEGLLKRPRPTRFNNEAGVGNMSTVIRVENSRDITIGINQAKNFVRQHVEEFRTLGNDEPGQWVMSEGDSSIVLRDREFVAGRGQLASLSRAIPLPDPSFPIAELLEFKERRRSEILALSFELDKFYSHISKSTDSEFELERLLRVVDKHCADMIKASKESKWSFYLGDLNVSFSINNVETAWSRAPLWEIAGQSYGLPVVGGIIGGASSFVSFDRGIGARNINNRQSPFRVVTTMHKELIN